MRTPQLLLALALVAVCALAHPLASHAHARKVVLSTGHLNTLEHPTFARNERHTQRVRAAGSEAKQQYLVQVQAPASLAKKQLIERAIGHELGQYLPHNTWVLYGTPAVAEAAAQLPEVVWVGVFEPEYKQSPQLAHAQAGAREYRLSVALVHGPFAEQDEVERLAASWSSSFRGRPVRFEAVSLERIVASTTSFKLLSTLVAFLVDQPETHFVHPDVAFETHEKFVDPFVQSGGDVLTPLFDNRINGTGYIVGIGDSGVDVDSCFFADPVHPNPPFNSENPTAEVHRKIVQYSNKHGGDLADGTGHGTYVAGVVLGEVYWPDDAELQQNLTAWNGGAFGSRLCFIDMNRASDQQNLVPPQDLYANYFTVFGECGAKTSVNAWGSTARGSSYTSQDRDVDKYVYDYPKHLPIFSAGNSGADGLGTISVPASAKNALAVGSAMNTNEAPLFNIPVGDYASLAATYTTEVCNETSTIWYDSKFCFDATGSTEIPCNTPEAIQFVCNQFRNDPIQACCSFLKDKCCAAFDEERINNYPTMYGPQCMSSFSSRGPTYDGRIKPDVVAPGEVVFGTRLQTTTQCSNFDGPSSPDPSVTQRSGTSSAAAVAGAQAVLVREYFERGFYPSGDAKESDAFEPPASLIKAALVHSAAPLKYVSGSNDINYGENFNLVTAPDNYQGFGRIISRDGVLFSATAVSAFKYNASVATINTGEKRTFCLRATDSAQPLKVTLVWTDPPASLSAGIALVNNLDLMVSDSEGSIWYANGQAGYDNLNNVERIVINAPVTGRDYIVHIFGDTIPQGPQEYSLVISGLYDTSCQASRTCPRGCSFNGQCSRGSGECECTAPYRGPDCSKTPCANCTDHGYCSQSGVCVCTDGWTGEDCGEAVPLPSSNTGQTIVEGSDGIAVGAFIGVVIAAFVFGAILALFIGVYLGTKYAEHRRKRAKEKANQMLSVERRSSD